jgi:hypothetical protein
LNNILAILILIRFVSNLEFSSPELIAYYLNKKLTGLNAESLTELNLPFTYKVTS